MAGSRAVLIAEPRRHRWLGDLYRLPLLTWVLLHSRIRHWHGVYLAGCRRVGDRSRAGRPSPWLLGNTHPYAPYCCDVFRGERDNVHGRLSFWNISRDSTLGSNFAANRTESFPRRLHFIIVAAWNLPLEGNSQPSALA